MLWKICDFGHKGSKPRVLLIFDDEKYSCACQHMQQRAIDRIVPTRTNEHDKDLPQQSDLHIEFDNLSANKLKS